MSDVSVEPAERGGWANKVPEVTAYFWIIKVLCTTVGETAADYLNTNLGFGLTGTSLVTGVLLVAALVAQFAARRYVPWRYWVTVALVSIFGTLVTDNLTDRLKVRLEVSTVVFAALLAMTFGLWFATDRTLSIHSIRTRRREVFYWLAVLCSFALGTAAGDLMAERLGLGYSKTGFIIAGLIAVTALVWRLGMHPVLGFWLVYVFTRPLGASIGDFLSQDRSVGGLGLGTTVTSVLFLGAILVVVVYLTISKADVVALPSEMPVTAARSDGGMWQTAVASVVLIGGGFVGYAARSSALDRASAQLASGTAATGVSKIGDLSVFRTIVVDTKSKLDGGDQAGATKRVDDLEKAWDDAQPRLQALDGQTWTIIDGKVDTVLKRLRAGAPSVIDEDSAMSALLQTLDAASPAPAG